MAEVNEAAFVAGRGAGKTWALCQWQRQDPEHRVIVVEGPGIRSWVAVMLDPTVHPNRQRGLVTVGEVKNGVLRGRPKETLVAIDEWWLCNRAGGGSLWLEQLHPFPIVAYTDTGPGTKTQAEFLAELGVPT